ncbi:MAG: hypothetical protein OJF55_001684 [Rhodanobacteraceae bacterium]|nr:MAG: hypothetical protein OJF55_001684 [Rhodanobacteraceae bacterium]
MLATPSAPARGGRFRLREPDRNGADARFRTCVRIRIVR